MSQFSSRLRAALVLVTVTAMLPSAPRAVGAQDGEVATSRLAAAASGESPRNQRLLDQPAKLRLRTSRLGAALDALQASSGVPIAYSPSRLPKDHRVACDCRDMDVESALSVLLAGTRLEAIVAGQQVVVTEREAPESGGPGRMSLQPLGMLADARSPGGQAELVRMASLGAASRAEARQGTVTGRVLDASNLEPMAGVQVSIRGLSLGTITGANGQFTIGNVPAGTHTLVAQQIGYEQVEPLTVTVTDGQQTVTPDVLLRQTAVALQEIVVVGYGTQTAESLTGSVSRADPEAMAKVARPTVSQALQGRAPGVFIKNANAQPGENKVNISIRGFGEPLFIVDGHPVEPSVFNEIDSNDIEDLVVLKDAASAAVYGARAGNGVVLVQTKRGSATAAPQITYKSEFARQFMLPTAIPDAVNSYEWAELRNMVDQNEGRPLMFSAEEIELYRQHADGSDPQRYPNTNMWDIALRDYAPMSQHNLSARGGTEAVRYFVSGGWMNQRGILVSDDINFDRYNLRSNIDVALTDKLDVGLSLSGNARDYIGPRNQMEGESWAEGQGISARLFRWRPWYPAAPIPGHPDLLRGGGEGGTPNPYNMTFIKNTGHIDWEGQFGDVSATVAYELPFGFTTRGVFNTNRDVYNYERYQKIGPEYQWNPATDEVYQVRVLNEISELVKRTETTNRQNVQFFLDWDRSFGDHSLTGTYVHERISDRFEMVEASRVNYDVDIPRLAAGPDKDKDNAGEAWRDGRIGHVGRLNYTYAGKYAFEVNSRYDGSARFPAEGRWGFFPSVSGAWQISEEPFIRDNAFLSFIDNLRFRASYGRLGYDRAGRFQHLSTYSFANPYLYDNGELSRGIESDQIPNPLITWEKADLANVGVNFNLWNGFLSGEFDVFRRDRFDVLANRVSSLPDVVGAQLPQENYQRFRNTGWDLSLNHNHALGGLRYGIGANVSANRQKTVFTDERHFVSREDERRNSLIGQWTDRVWRMPTDGLFQSQEEIDNWADIDGQNNASMLPGDVKFVDTNGDGRITVEDAVIVGSGNQPRFTYGILSSLGWGGFDFSMTWQGAGRYGYDLRNSSNHALPFSSDATPLGHHLRDSYVEPGNPWRPANTDARWPRLRRNNRGPSYNGIGGGVIGRPDIWWVDASYLRLRDAQLAYRIPQSVTGRLGLGSSGVRLLLSGYNLLTFTAVDFLDPEVDTNARQQFANYHPQMGSYHLGVEMVF